MMTAGIKMMPVFKGATAVARELKVSKTHLWMVMHGRRQSKRLTARLAKLGIQCPISK